MGNWIGGDDSNTGGVIVEHVGRILMVQMINQKYQVICMYSSSTKNKKQIQWYDDHREEATW